MPGMNDRNAGAAPPARVLMTTDAVGGVWRQSLDLAAGFRAAGSSVLLAVLGPPPTPEQQLAARRIRGLQLVVTNLPLEWTAETPLQMRQTATTLSALAARSGAETAHLHSPALACIAWPIPVIAMAHSCVGTWWRAVHPGQAMPPDLAWRAAMMRAGLQQADWVLAPSQTFADALAECYGGAGGIGVVRNGRRLNPPAGIPRRNQMLTAGRLWDEGKNVRLISEAVPWLGMPGFAAGALRGPHGAKVRLANVKALGELDEAMLAMRMAESRFYVAPALYEPFGLAVLEAALCGCTLVLSDIPSFRELWDEAAIFFDPRDGFSLVEAIKRMAADPRLEMRLNREAAARARRLTPEDMSAATIAHHAMLLDTVRKVTV